MKKYLIPAMIVVSVCISSCKKEEPKVEDTANQTQNISQNTNEQKISDKSDKKDSNIKKAYEKKDTYFSLPSLSGSQIDLANYSNKPVLLVFFTENCPYCRKAAPAMQELYQKYSSKGLTVVGISTKDDPEATKEFAKELGIKFPLAYRGRRIAINYRVQGVPFIYMLDKNHEIYDAWMGYDDSYLTEIESAIGHTL